MHRGLQHSYSALFPRKSSLHLSTHQSPLFTETFVTPLHRTSFQRALNMSTRTHWQFFIFFKLSRVSGLASIPAISSIATLSMCFELFKKNMFLTNNSFVKVIVKTQSCQKVLYRCVFVRESSWLCHIQALFSCCKHLCAFIKSMRLWSDALDGGSMDQTVLAL